MTKLLVRAISGFIYAVLFISAILFSKETYILLILIFGIASLWEFFKLLKFKNLLLYGLLIVLTYLAFTNSLSETTIKILLTLCFSGSFQLFLNLFMKKENYPSNKIQGSVIDVLSIEG